MIYQKVDDMYNQEAIINLRKYNIALVTDSIADLPQTLIDEHQIQIVHLDILHKGINYFDKLTIQPSRLLEMVSNEDELPASSQPNPMQIDNLLDYLSTYYNSIIIITVSKELSGTYNSFYNSAKNYKNRNINISVINSKQNSGAKELASLMTHIIGHEPDYIMETSSIIAVSAGEGAVAISYLLVKEVYKYGVHL